MQVEWLILRAGTSWILDDVVIRNLWHSNRSALVTTIHVFGHAAGPFEINAMLLYHNAAYLIEFYVQKEEFQGLILCIWEFTRVWVPLITVTGSWCAGQAIVQMAKSQNDSCEYAIKFFASRATFEAELAMYDTGGSIDSSSLAQFLPKVLPPTPASKCICED
jgi:hypothetical protein